MRDGESECNCLNSSKRNRITYLGDVFVTAGVSGLANASILAIINAAAQSAAYDHLNFRYLAMFLVGSSTS